MQLQPTAFAKQIFPWVQLAVAGRATNVAAEGCAQDAVKSKMTYISPWSYRRRWCRWAAGGVARPSPGPRLFRWLGSRRTVWSQTSSAPTLSHLGSGGQLVSRQSDWHCGPLTQNTHTVIPRTEWHTWLMFLSFRTTFFSLCSHISLITFTSYLLVLTFFILLFCCATCTYILCSYSVQYAILQHLPFSRNHSFICAVFSYLIWANI